jgi:type I restriction enzyme M protein
MAETYTEWKEVEKYSRVVTCEEFAKNDYNVSPSRYVNTSESEEFRPITDIVEELEALEREIAETNKTLKSTLLMLTL